MSPKSQTGSSDGRSDDGQGRIEERIDALEASVWGLKAQIDMLATMMARRDGAAPVAAERPPAPTGAGAQDGDGPDLTEFSAKQHAVMQLIVEGQGTDDMAGVLEVQPSTIKVHVRGIMKRLRVRSRAQIAMIYRRLMSETAAEDYRRITTLPHDWARDPDQYPEVTRMLRVKTR